MKGKCYLNCWTNLPLFLMLKYRSLTNDEKTHYLERIARHFLGNITFDVSNLRNISEKIEQEEDNQWPPMMEESQSDEEDETKTNEDNFTVKTLSDNTARMYNEHL